MASNVLECRKLGCGEWFKSYIQRLRHEKNV